MSRCAPAEDLVRTLVEAAIAGASPAGLLEALCRALVAGGLPLARASVGALLVHPLLDATLVIWRPNRGAYLDDTPRPAVRGNEAWRGSPPRSSRSPTPRAVRKSACQPSASWAR